MKPLNDLLQDLIEHARNQEEAKIALQQIGYDVCIGNNITLQGIIDRHRKCMLDNISLINELFTRRESSNENKL